MQGRNSVTISNLTTAGLRELSFSNVASILQAELSLCPEHQALLAPTSICDFVFTTARWLTMHPCSEQ